MEICWEKERSESNSTPRLRAWMLGEMGMPRKDMEQLVILERCCLVPIRRKFSFGRVHSKTVQGEPRVDGIKSGG